MEVEASPEISIDDDVDTDREAGVETEVEPDDPSLRLSFFGHGVNRRDGSLIGVQVFPENMA